MKAFIGLPILGLALSATQATAWDNFGHMEVAALAWAQLTPKVQSRVAELLNLNPEHSNWIQGVAAQQRGQIAFVMAATWPDFIKRDPSYRSDGPEGGDRPPATAEASQNKGYVDHFRHKYWHFVDEPFSPDQTPIQQPATPNAETQIAAFRATLSAEGGSDDVKSYDLVWLLHLVGDVHQPLHAASRFIQGEPNGDAGGNRVKIHCGSGCDATELHAFWDDVLGTSDDPNEAITAAAQLPAPDARAASIADEHTWINESFGLARANVYVAPIGVGTGPFPLTDKYKSDALRLAKERIALAGARLANLLNAALK
jgi:hypothetical protein